MTDKLTPEALAEIKTIAQVVCEELCAALGSVAIHQQRAILWREAYMNKVLSGMETREAAVYADTACVSFDRQFKDLA